MANKIILKKTSTASKVPLATDLEVGEIAVNLADQKLYSKNASGTVILVGDGQGTGDVTGGSSSTDNALARYDGTTGKVIQNSTITLDDDGNLASVNAVSFDTTPATLPTSAGSMYWDVDYGTPAIIMGGGNVTQQVGEDSFYFGKNQTGSTIPKGTVVRANGTLGASGRILIAPAIGDNSTPPEYFMGVTAEAIADGADGIVQWFGSIKGIDTTGQNGETWANGDVLYLSPTVAGSFTNVEPVAPNQKTIVALVIYANANGTIFVRPTIGHTLQDVNNVNITSPANSNILTYNSSTQTWTNQTVNEILPSQSGNTGKVLGTDGTNISWVASGGGGGSFFSPYLFTATASQTTFAVGVALDAVQVYVNGTLQVPSTDYSISGTDIVLTTGAPVGAIVQVNVYTAFSVADTYSTSVIDTNFASKTSLGDLAYLDTVGSSEIDDTSITVAKLNATGTPSSTTYLRGDGSWAVPSSLLAGQVIETISSPCDGSSITVQSGTYTVQNVTAQQGYVGATYTDINGSVISYTPPAGTTRVEYEFEFASYWVSAHAINDYIFFIDGVEVVYARHNRSGYYPEFRFPFKWTIAIGGTPNTNTGRIASWTTPKVMKMQYRQYGGSNYNNLHGTTYWNGGASNQFSMPHIKITAIA